MRKQFAVFLTLLSCAAPYCSQAALPKPIDSYFRRQIEAYALSPDGSSIAYGKRAGSDLMLHIRHIDSGEERSLKVGEDQPNLEDVHKIVRDASMPFVDWATDGRLIYKPDSYRVFAINSDFTEQKELLRFREQDMAGPAQIFFYAQRLVRSLLLDDPDHILLESSAVAMGLMGGDNNYDFYKVNIHTGAATPVNGALGAGGAKSLFADASGRIRAKLWNRTSAGPELQVIDPATDKMTPVEELLGSDLAARFKFGYKLKGGADSFASQAVLLRFGHNPDWMFFGSNDGRDTYSVYAFNLRSKELRGPLLEHPNFDVVSPRSLVAGNLLVSDYTKSLIAISTELEKPYRVWLDDRFAAAQEEVDAVAPKSVNRITSWSRDLQRVVVDSSAEDQLSRVWVFDRTTRSAIPIDEEETEGFINLPVWIQAPEGHRILCYLTVPKSVKPGAPNKMAVNLHGGPWARDYLEPDAETRMLADAGYTVLRVNYRGSVGFGRSFAMAGQGRLGDAALDDVMTAIEWCAERRLAAKGDIVAMGGSFGGYLALYASARYPEVFSRCVAIAPVTDLARQIKEGRTDSTAAWSSYIFWNEMVGDIRRSRKQVDEASPINLVGNFTRPVMLIHGDDDSVVNHTQSQNLFRALKKLSSEHQYVKVKDAGHGGWSPEQRELIYGNLFAFLDAGKE